MDSYRITSHLSDDLEKQKKINPLTIVPIIREIKVDLQNSLFDYEQEWDTIWELITVSLREIGFESYCIEPLIQDIYERMDEDIPDTKQEDSDNLDYLKMLELPEQRTKEWFEFRQTRLTASELSYCISQPIESAVSQKIMLQKIKPEAVPYISSAATSHGTLFEPVAQYVYERLYKQKLYEFGCVPHKDIDWLAASPDGISEEGVMVEIKCPYSRSPRGVPSLTYYTQIQAQQEVCDLEWCDFMECLIETYDSRNDYIRDTVEKGDPQVKKTLSNQYYRGTKREYLPKNGILKGMALVIETKNGVKYECMEWDQMQSMKSLDWMNMTLNRYYEDDTLGVSGYTVKHWILREVWITRIQRNREWFESMMPKAEEFWQALLKKKEEGIEVPLKKVMTFVEETI